MKITRGKAGLTEAVDLERLLGRSIGIVPTMGFLHEGHLSLVDRAREEVDFVVLSIFVNPTQFGPGEDLEEYPRDLNRDLALAQKRGVNLVFAPDAGEMYEEGHATWVDVEGLTEGLCGASRPGHFRGVTTIVAKLFGLCRPHRAYFGQKDAQQAFVIRRMVRDLDMGVEVVLCPIVREPDGLALSSRNVYLTSDQRRQAPVIHQALSDAERLFSGGERDAARLVETVREGVETAPDARIEYVESVETGRLTPVSSVEPGEGQVLLAVAVRFGRTRLIDNVLLDPGPG